MTDALRFAISILRSCALYASLLCSCAAHAHHSTAGYDPEERSVFEGTITDIFWGNPHILFTVSDGSTAMRIEWITTTGADKTEVPATRFHLGDRLIVIGSRHPNPEVSIMTLIKELQLPSYDWRWISPSVQRKHP